MLLPKLYWTRILNLIIQKYLFDTTVCIIWNDNIEFDLELHQCDTAIVNINKIGLYDSFALDVLDYSVKRQQMLSNGVVFDDLVEKLTMSIEKSHCESFLAFQADIPIFVEAFNNASRYSIWRSVRNKFVFAFYSDLVEESYFHHYLFEDQPRILLVESETFNSTIFDLKTNKFVGPRAEHPESIYLLDRFDAISETFENYVNLFPDKMNDLMGREVILAAFDYRPAIVLKYDTESNVRDLAFEDPAQGAALIDGTETRVLLTFCEKYNCTVQIDTSEANDWGVVYPNMSGDGALGMIAKRKAEVGMGAMYSWYVDYIYLDMSMYLVRSGITCVVPAPRRLASWLLPLEPFQGTLWCAVLSCLCIEVVGLLFTHKFEHSIVADNNTWLNSFKYGFATTFKLFISQSGNEDVQSVSIRVLLLSCFMIDIIITSIYGGGLASILTIPSFEEAADSLERLQSLQLKWAANSEAWVMTIRNTDDDRMNEILKNFDIYTDEQLREMALTENMGFTVERLPFGHFAIEDYLTQEAIDRVKIMQDDIYFQYTVTFVPRIWSLLAKYDNLIYMWHSSGFDKFWEWRIVADNLNGHIQKEVEASMFSNFDDIGPVKLGMSNFVGILVIWVLGIALAILAFFGELMFYRFKVNGEEMLPIEDVFEWTTY